MVHEDSGDRRDPRRLLVKVPIRRNVIEGPGSKYKLAFSCGSLIQPALFIV